MASPRPRVSVVIPTRDRARLLEAALSSVADQTLAPCETIVVDDGSSDDTAAVVRSAARRTRYLRFSAARGRSAARNAGIAAARGDYVAFLDDDDLWYPRKLELQSRELEREGAGFSYHDMDALRRDGSVAPGLVSRCRGWMFLHLRPFFEAPVVTSSVMARTDRLRAAGGFKDVMNACEDVDLWLRIAVGGVQPRFLPECLGLKRLAAPKPALLSPSERLDFACFSYQWGRDLGAIEDGADQRGDPVLERLGAHAGLSRAAR